MIIMAIRAMPASARLSRFWCVALALFACTATMVATSSMGVAADKDGDNHKITAQDFKFSGVPKSIEAGTFNFTFVNKTPDSPHLIDFVKIASNEAGDVTLKEAIAAADKQDLCPSGCFFTKEAGGAFADPSATVPGQAKLSKGKYAYFCFITEPDLTPHYHLGMAGLITVKS